MPKFLTIGYSDDAGYRRTPVNVREEAHSHDAKLMALGVTMGRVGSPLQVRNPEGLSKEVTKGAYSRADLPVAGFAVIEARDIDEAVQIASRSPCAVAHGVVEVWPLLDPTSPQP